MAGQTLKPPFAYYGGKTTLAPKIAALLPDHKHYVEPFAGSLAVLLAKEPTKWETVNDLDGDLVNFWRVLRDQPEDLERVCAMTPHSREEFEKSANLDIGDALERARRTWVRLNQGRTHSMRHSGWWRGVRGSSDFQSIPAQLSTRASRISPAAARMLGVTIENRDAVEMIQEYGAESSVCIYADPPYLGSVRAGGYRMEMLEDDLHVRLANALRDCKSSVVLSGYASPLYEELFNGWHRTEMKAPNTMARTAAPNEVLWSNVPLGQQSSFDFEGITA